MLVSMPPTLLDCTLAITPITCGGTFMPGQQTSSTHAHTLCHVRKARRQSAPWRGPYSCPPAILNDEELLSSGAAASGAFKSLPASMSPVRRQRNYVCCVTGCAVRGTVINHTTIQDVLTPWQGHHLGSAFRSCTERPGSAGSRNTCPLYA